MPEQLPLDLPLRAAVGRADFAVSDANRAAMALIDTDDSWPKGKLVLHGPQGAGKTHLACVWAESSGALIVPARDLVGLADDITKVVVEDVPQIAGDAALEEALFHLHNRVLAENGRLLMTGQGVPASWGLSLPDLASRVQGTLAVALDPPDDELLTYVLVKLFADRQLAPSPRAISTLVLHMERSFTEAGRLVGEMDRRAIAERRRITDALARDVLGL